VQEKPKSLLSDLCTKGIKFPFALDPISGQPSVTLLAMYISIVASSVSLIAVHFFPSIILATGMCFMFYAMTTTFYLIRRVQHAKFDLKDGDFGLDGGDDHGPGSN
jgi:hypothetical protein